MRFKFNILIEGEYEKETDPFNNVTKTETEEEREYIQGLMDILIKEFQERADSSAVWDYLQVEKVNEQHTEESSGEKISTTSQVAT